MPVLLSGCALQPPGTSTSENGSTAASPLGISAQAETDLYRQAITALNNSQLDQAEKDLKTIIHDRPEFAGPWLNLALIELKRKNTDKAEVAIAKALERNPKMPQAYNVRAYVAVSKGDIKAAADDYRHALAIKEDYALAHYNLALLYDTYFQDAKTAVRHYKRFLALTDNADKKTADWVVELERMIAKGAE